MAVGPRPCVLVCASLLAACAAGDAAPTVAPLARSPARDGDGDGVRDDADLCPETRGERGRGCPIRDADVETALAVTDTCVDTREVLNGYQDDDGCPDEIPKSCGCSPVGRFEDVWFPTGKVLTADARAGLDRVADGLINVRPTMRVEIAGHTDSHEQGRDPTRQRALALARAEAARRYLVEVKGIDAARLEVRGVGSGEPIDTNKTAAGRRRNRRVEFVILIY